MNNLDLKVIKQEQPVIEINFEEMKTNLKEYVQQYSSLVVTDTTLPMCKQQQKELAGIRIKIDNYRKDVKKEMSKPIDEFEGKCKQLIQLVEEAEQPLKDGIKVYDDKKRDEKRQIAEGIIKAIIEEKGLSPKYAQQLQVLDKYTNLTSKASEVREDVEQRAFILLGEQKKEQEMLEIIQDTIDNANKTIKTPIHMTDFQRLIDRGISPKDIIAEINSRAEQIRKAEMPKPESEKPQGDTTPQVEPEKPTQAAGEPQEMYYVELRVVGSKLDIGNLGQYLRGNGYNFTLVKQGKIE